MMTPALHALITRLETLAQRTPRTLTITRDDMLTLLDALRTALAAQDVPKDAPETEEAGKGQL